MSKPKQEVIAAPTMVELLEAERYMREGFTTMAHALYDVHAGSLYRAAGYEEFLAYCKERLGLTRGPAYRLLGVGELVEQLSKDSPVRRLLTHEWQVRGLEGMPVKNKIGVLERAAREAEKRKAPLTGALVMEIARRGGWKSRAEYLASKREAKETEQTRDQKMAAAAVATRDALEAAFAAILQYGDARALVDLVGDPQEILGFESARLMLNDMLDAWTPPDSVVVGG